MYRFNGKIYMFLTRDGLIPLSQVISYTGQNWSSNKKLKKLLSNWHIIFPTSHRIEFYLTCAYLILWKVTK